MIKLAQKVFVHVSYKFRIWVPDRVNEAFEIDKANGNTLWMNAIKKEMDEVWIAFDLKEKGDNLPGGYKKIQLWMIFNVKMDFTWKAQQVAGGHVMDPPTSMTYSSVMSRDSVQLAFLIAALNDLEVF
jgi:hypothetical protein